MTTAHRFEAKIAELPPHRTRAELFDELAVISRLNSPPGTVPRVMWIRGRGIDIRWQNGSACSRASRSFWRRPAP